MSVPLNAAARRRVAFHSLEVADVRRLTDDAVEVTFSVPEQLAGFYDYLPGQYVALRVRMPDAAGVSRELRRSYSLCAVPVQFADGSSELKIAIKRDLGGEFSTWATTELAPGTFLDVMSPSGAFISRHAATRAATAILDTAPLETSAPGDPTRNVLTSMNHPEQLLGRSGHFVAIAAGSGITPVMALAASLLSGSPSTPSSPINSETRLDLVYANKGTMDVMFLEELADMKDRYPDRLAVHHVLSREQRIAPLLSGRLDANKLEALLDKAIHAEDVVEWFLCGPFELVQLSRDVLRKRGVPQDRIRFELFTTGRPDRPEAQHGRTVRHERSEENYKITFTLDGRTTEVMSPVHARESILNAALRLRPDVPFACAGGVCGTCRTKLIAGKVTMDENYALEPEELDADYILSCQSHPTTPEITVDYDA